jgi:hypothetical protein
MKGTAVLCSYEFISIWVSLLGKDWNSCCDGIILELGLIGFGTVPIIRNSKEK